MAILRFRRWLLYFARRGPNPSWARGRSLPGLTLKYSSPANSPMFKAIKKFRISRGSALNVGLNPASYGDGPSVDGYHWEFVLEDDGSYVMEAGKYVVDLVADATAG